MRLLPLLSLFALLVLSLSACDRATLETPSTLPISRERSPDGLLLDDRLQALVEAQTRRDGETLTRALSDPDSSVRARAAFALGSVEHAEAADALVALLTDSVALVRADAAFALGQLRDEDLADTLLAVLRMEDARAVQAELIEALGKTATFAHLDSLAALPLPAELRSSVVRAQALAASQRQAPPALYARMLEALEAPDVETRHYAAYAFGRPSNPTPWRMHADAVRDHLDAFLAADDPAAMYLVRALRRLSDPADVDRLARALQEASDWRIRAEAASAVGPHRRDSEAAAGLLAALGDEVPLVAVAAAIGLGQTWDPLPAETVDAVEAWLRAHPESWHVGVHLLPVLAVSGRAQALWTHVGRYRRLAPAAHARALHAVAHLPGSAAFDTLATRVDAAEPMVGAAAVQALQMRWDNLERTDGARPESAYFDAFTRALRRPDLALRYAAAPALRHDAFVPLGSVDSLTAVYRTLRTPDDVEPMQAIAQSLNQIDHADARAFVVELCRTAPSAVQLYVCAAVTDEAAKPPLAAPDWALLERLGPEPRLVLSTDLGEIVIALDAESAPATVSGIARLAEAGRYDGVPFHRVVPNFVIQGGDYARGDGFGGSDVTLPSEFTRLRFERGTIGMASAGKDTEGAQFFITHSMQPHLDGRYTAFGRVIDGTNVVDRIVEGIRIIRARIQPTGD